MKREWVLLGLGANLQDPASHLRATMALLRERFAAPDADGWRASGLWRTAPLNCPPGSPDFVNATVAFPLSAALRAQGPDALLRRLLALEAASGRPRQRPRNAPRVLDIDLLLFGSETSLTPECAVPHPRALERRFVLEPAAEVLPDLVWPGETRTLAAVAAMLRDAAGQEDVFRLP